MVDDSEKVNVNDIKDKPNEILPPDDLAKEEVRRQADQRKFAAELGWVGKFFGGRQEKPGNISGLVILICFALIAILICIRLTIGFEKTELFTALFGIITLTLGYLFGSNTKDD